MVKKRNKLSPIRELYCVNCHTLLILNLEERRGDEDILCSVCKATFSLKEGISFISKLSNIKEGRCPNCFVDLEFDVESRLHNDLLTCPGCNQAFYIEESLPERTKTVGVYPKNSEKKNHYLVKVLKYYHPQLRINEDGYGWHYFVEEDSFNRKLFLRSFIILTISLALVISLINIPEGYARWSYEFSDWAIDFLGWTLGFSIPSLIVSYIIGKVSKNFRELSVSEINEYIGKYEKKKNKK